MRTLGKGLFPARLGILIGSTVGLILGIRTVLEQDYLDYRLYYTTIRVLAIDLDVYSALGILSFYALFCIGWLCRWLNGGSTKTTVLRGSILTIVLFWVSHPSSCLFASARTSELLTLVKAVLFEALLRVLALVVIVFVGLLLVRRRKRLGYLVDERRVNWIGGRARLLVAPLTRISGIALVFLLIINLAYAFFHMSVSASAQQRPNIVLIMVDTLRADHVSCYGYPHKTTPRIDAFASESTRFTRAVAQASFTLWSVSSFMTSHYPQELMRGRTQAGRLENDRLTLAEVLREHGYSTAAVVSNTILTQKMGIEQGFEVFDNSMSRMDISSPFVLSSTQENLRKLRNKPFFMFAVFMDPHSPYISHRGFDPGNLKNTVEMRIDPVAMPARMEEGESGRSYQAMRNVYDSEIAFTDHHIGMLLDELKSLGLYDNTLIVLLSDHGEEFGDHGGTFHGFTLYNEVINVPLVVKVPRQTRGRVVDGKFALIDLFPSMLATVGIDPSDYRLQGEPVDLGGTDRLRDKLIFSATNLQKELRSVIAGDHKYIDATQTGHAELYDEKADPTEERNIADKHRDISSQLHRAIGDHEGKLALIGGRKQGKEVEFTEEEKERLRSLGYLQ